MEYENKLEKTGIWQANRRIMDDITAGGHRRIDTTRPTLGFPLGTALVLLIVFGISALFSCCYHWEKLRTLHNRQADTTASTSTRNSFSDSSLPTVHVLPLHAAPDSASSKNSFQQRQSLPVLMPGDSMPRFIAWPSPHGFMPQSN